MKRFIDIPLSVLGMLGCVPFVGLAALAITLTSQGPVIYTSKRQGNKGIFSFYKLRTMYMHSAWRPDYDSTISPNDPRITPVGKLLRRFSIDELTQFYHVFKGDLHLVGKRPVDVEYLEHIKLKNPLLYTLRSSPPLGLYAYHALGSRKNATQEEELCEIKQYDDAYHHSLIIATDLKLFLKSFYVVVKGRGAH